MAADPMHPGHRQARSCDSIRHIYDGRLTPRCSGRHPGDLSNVLASGVHRPYLRTARVAGAAELKLRSAHSRKVMETRHD